MKKGTIKNAIGGLFRGRYGADQYGRFLLIFALIIMVIGMITNNVAGTILMGIATGLIIYAYVRMMSKKPQKCREENRVYLYRRNSVLAFFKITWRKLKEGRSYKFFKCPKCAIVVRIPKGAGTVQITCPKCGEKFIKKA